MNDFLDDRQLWDLDCLLLGHHLWNQQLHDKSRSPCGCSATVESKSYLRRLDLREQPLRHDRCVDDLADGLQQRTSIGTETALSKLGRLLTPLFLCSRPLVVQERACQKPYPISATAKSPRASKRSGTWAPVVAHNGQVPKLIQNRHLLDLHGLPHGLPCGYMP